MAWLAVNRRMDEWVSWRQLAFNSAVQEVEEPPGGPGDDKKKKKKVGPYGMDWTGMAWHGMAAHVCMAACIWHGQGWQGGGRDCTHHGMGYGTSPSAERPGCIDVGRDLDLLGLGLPAQPAVITSAGTHLGTSAHAQCMWPPRNRPPARPSARLPACL